MFPGLPQSVRVYIRFVTTRKIGGCLQVLFSASLILPVFRRSYGESGSADVWGI